MADAQHIPADGFNTTAAMTRLQGLLAEADMQKLAPPTPLQAAIARAIMLTQELLAQGRFVHDGAAGLAPWQARRVRQLVTEKLHESLTVQDMAAAARLSRSAFSRAFSASFGTPPHAWLLAQRVEKAKELMEQSSEPLAQIALSCGLADQAHLSRVFRRHMGVTPASWRRATNA